MSFAGSAQKKSDSDTIQGKLIRNINFKDICKAEVYKNSAVVIQIELTDPFEIKKFGRNLFVATICEDEFSESWYDDSIYKFVISTQPYYIRKFDILNPELFKLNVDQKIYWLHDFLGSKKIIINCRTKCE